MARFNFMDLRTGQPVWLANDPDDFSLPRLNRNLSCDVVIVGAGVTAALTAHQLICAGLSVVVLDRRAIARGSTAASTGLLLFQTDTSLKELTKLHGAKTAKRAYWLGRKSVAEIGEVVRTLKLDCGFKSKRTLYVASDEKGRKKLREEAKRSHRIHLPATLLSEKELKRAFGFSGPAALSSSGCAQVNAFRLTRGIFRHYCQHPKVKLFQHTSVTKLTETVDGVIATTSRGHRVRARHAIVAAGYESGRFGKNPLVKLHSTYVIASHPFPAHPLWPKDALMWETARPYFYLRLTSDRRIVFGGQDESFSDERRRDALLKKKTRALEKQFAGLFPRYAFKAEFAWTGTFAETVDGLPVIGSARKGSHVLYALGYGGNGITFSQIAARILRDQILGRSNPDAALFRLDRKVRK
jgi:glycine/D-amino acid oxidase-like deaminating enzyme